ncbi:hypothetical protein [Mucilaginibacter segetis]|uniref:Uncharacterized protein n=1 Tax=Mucilaginibacter segetis TaxID=2793071 RepID=A0A934UL77_9SPHI|nr:hypothetical protein [Mucilaginibacter segetis]MBK0378054.1 hypothetical protein [Mucilaginibacter segetis]
MKKKLKRSILIFLAAVIVFSATMAIPELYNSEWKILLQGAAFGLAFSAIFIWIKLFTQHLKGDKQS